MLQNLAAELHMKFNKYITLRSNECNNVNNSVCKRFAFILVLTLKLVLSYNSKRHGLLIYRI